MKKLILLLICSSCYAEVLYTPVLINNFNGNQKPATNFLSLSSSNLYLIMYKTNVPISEFFSNYIMSHIVTKSHFTDDISTNKLNYNNITNVPPVRTNWPLTSITNANYLTNWSIVPTNYEPVKSYFVEDISTNKLPYSAITNPPAARTNWAITDTTNSLNLTNWALLSTNIVPAGQTNIAIIGVTNSSYLTNWALVPTNYVPPQTTHATNADKSLFVDDISTNKLNWNNVTNQPSVRVQWAITDITNSLYLTNWALIDTNSLGDAVQQATNSSKTYTDNATNSVLGTATARITSATNSILISATNSAATYTQNATNDVLQTATNSAKTYTDNATNGIVAKARFVADISTNQIPLSGVTNSGTAAYSNAAAFLLASGTAVKASFVADASTNQLPISGITNLSIAASGPAGVTWSAALTGNGTLTALTPGILLTNGESQAITFSNNITVDATHTFLATSITNNALSANTAVIADANKKEISLANGGNNTLLHGTTPPAYTAVVIADISTPGIILTNGEDQATTISNTFTIDATHAMTATSITNKALTANTAVIADANSKEVSLANGGNNTVLHGTTPPAYSSVVIADISTPGIILTNGESQSTTFSNNVTVDATHNLIVNGNLTNGVLTASRLVFTDANKALSSAAASGAVPIDADGSATTSAQVNILFPGFIVTNGVSAAFTVSNTFTVDAAHAMTTTSITNNALTANTLVLADANKKMISLTANADVRATVTGGNPPVWSTRPFGIFSGNTGGVNLATGNTSFWALNGNTVTNVNTSDVSCWTRNLVTRTTLLTNFYIISSASAGTSKVTTYTIMTNGTASSLVITLNSPNTASNDVAHSETIVAGTEVGIKIITGSSVTPVKHSWSIEGL